MSLYTYTPSIPFSPVSLPEGLSITECWDIQLLSNLGEISVEAVRDRMANDNKAFVALLHNTPVAFGWMARDKVRIGELDHEFILPDGNRYLWNFRTLSAYRGLGIYPALLQYILQKGDKDAQRFWIIHAPENTASLKGIRKAGFKFIGRLYLNKENNAAIEASETALTLMNELNYMDIQLLVLQPDSCWNCSSPYLTRRSETCCCAPAGQICFGNRLHKYLMQPAQMPL